MCRGAWRRTRAYRAAGRTIGSEGSTRRSFVVLAAILSALTLLTTQALAADITGTPGSDTIVGTDGNDNINGLAGHDTISGDDGFDVIIGSYGFDTRERRVRPPLRALGQRHAVGRGAGLRTHSFVPLPGP